MVMYTLNFNIRIAFFLIVGTLLIACSTNKEEEDQLAEPPFTGETLHVGSEYEYKSLSDAIKVVEAGNMILLHEGVYEETGIKYLNDLAGTSDGYIIIRADKEGTVILRGGGLKLSTAAYIKFQNLTFEQHQLIIDDRYVFEKPAHHITFENCTFRSNNQGWGKSFLTMMGVDDFEIKNCQFLGDADCGGLSLQGCHRGSIKGCYIEKVKGNAIAVSGGSQQVLIEANMIKDCTDRSLVIGGQTAAQYLRPQNSTFEASDIKAHSNVIVGSRCPITYMVAEKADVVNNTIINPGQYVIAITQNSIQNETYIKCGNSSFVNNIVYRANGLTLDCLVGPGTDNQSFTFSNNLWYNYEKKNWNGPKGIPVLEPDIIIGKDPLFTDVENSDFSLLPNSPAIAKGAKVSSPEYDFNNNRFSPDRSIGAYEK